MSHDPKPSSNLSNEAILEQNQMEMSHFCCVKSICQDMSTLKENNSKPVNVPKLTKELIFGNLKCYESIVTTAKCLAKCQNDKLTILNNNIIAVERKLNVNHLIPYVKYEIMLINDEDDSDNENDCGDEHDNKSDSCSDEDELRTSKC